MSITDTTADITATIDTWLAAYTDADVERRTRAIAEVWNPEGQLLDPPLDGAGREAIGQLVDVVLSHFPGHTFRRTTAVDAHHDVARYGWELLGPDGTVTMTGLDVVTVDGAGRLLRVAGFFGEPAGA
jgi:hypothetical protein